jgi:hypothetical protein
VRLSTAPFCGVGLCGHGAADGAGKPELASEGPIPATQTASTAETTANRLNLLFPIVSALSAEKIRHPGRLAHKSDVGLPISAQPTPKPHALATNMSLPLTEINCLFETCPTVNTS